LNDKAYQQLQGFAWVGFWGKERFSRGGSGGDEGRGPLWPPVVGISNPVQEFSH